MLNDDAIVRLIKRHEGFKGRPYRCTSGKLTIGYGRNIEDNGITTEEATVLLKNDIKIAEHDAQTFYPPIYDLSESRQYVLIDMAFNLGYNRLSGFRLFRGALLNKDYILAAEEMLKSRWAKQVKNRAIRLAHMMEQG